jgi:hypothetical protein
MAWHVPMGRLVGPNGMLASRLGWAGAAEKKEKMSRNGIKNRKICKNEFDSLGVWFKEFEFKPKANKFKPSFGNFSRIEILRFVSKIQNLNQGH